MRRPTVDVIIPTFRPEASFRDLLYKLRRQSYPIEHILIINTGSEEEWDTELVEGFSNVEVFHISKNEFDHAGTRNMGAGFSGADYIVFMTQDAIPADDELIACLIRAFRTRGVRVAYARQLPRRTCRIPEGCVRSFNYPDRSEIHTLEDTGTIGIKAFFCSNVCAAYDHRLFRQMNGFTTPAIFNEDMVYAGRVAKLGYSIAYAADARVYHSHNYTNMQQFHRNFDNGVSQAMHPEIFSEIRSEGEGMHLVRSVTGQLWNLGRIYLIPGFYLQCVFRFAGFKLGKNYRKLPQFMIRAFTMNRSFWEQQETEPAED